MDDERPIKICLYGSSGVGCNQLSHVAIGQKFKEDSGAVSLWSCGEKTFIINKKEYIVNIWNGPGQEKYKEMFKHFVKNANIVIFVYDITYRYSFDELNEKINIAKEILGNNFIGAIVGNKKDLFEHEVVSEDEAREFAKEVGYKFALVSAKADQISFINLLEELIEVFIKNNEIKQKGMKNKIIEAKKKKIEKDNKKKIEEDKKKKLEEDMKKKIEEEKKRMNERKKSLTKNYKLTLLKYFSK